MSNYTIGQTVNYEGHKTGTVIEINDDMVRIQSEHFIGRMWFEAAILSDATPPAPTAEESARLRSPEELNIDPESRYSLAIGALVWDKTYNYKGANGGWLSRTIARNVQPVTALGQMRQAMTNPNLKDIHIYVEGF